ncbi:sensor histidine kinase KdpD [Blastococcus sp. TF02A-26]|uniref:sensor histidine kinase n=1 Tax=Blastococcus sp. TF02A-26 TaxID=2250577 RepID=UPI000DE9FE4D|nr:HAMP domain-containing sensor histidine kinase [Blastococcus sp. TF02A-26]RBY87513.1 sensor histidine kinase [Blastococcus sp. TF02A-26]
MTVLANPPAPIPPVRLVADLTRVVRAHLTRRRRPAPEEVPDPREALLRAMCHDMKSPLASLEAALRSLDGTAPERAEVLELARAQTAHLSSMLRTADATGGAQRRGPARRRLVDVVRAAIAASGLPDAQLTTRMTGCAADVSVADARVQRILTNLLENAHRHDEGRPVLLSVTCRPGWVDLALTQAGVPTDRVVGHLRTATPPLDLTGLGLWSVQRLTKELGGRVVAEDAAGALTLTIELPDR